MPHVIRSGSLTLPARPAGVRVGELRRVLHFEGDETLPRVLDIGSLVGHPFDAQLSWAGSDGVAAKAILSVATGTRVCVVARTLDVHLGNRIGFDHEVVALLADGLVATSNVYDIDFETAPTNENVPIPSFARAVVLQTSSTNATGTLSLRNGNDVGVAGWPINALPALPIPVGGASRLVVSCSSPCRVVYLLSI